MSVVKAEQVRICERFPDGTEVYTDGIQVGERLVFLDTGDSIDITDLAPDAYVRVVQRFTDWKNLDGTL